ncbi:pilin [Cysteiniphilum halobium]|uniref:pilin n=1 Tax=Cysteiniphilum halobium TaxID=2219059 RepID=UPI003F85B49B
MDIKQIKKMRKQKGFSLIELLIVIAIIAILTAIAIPMYTSYTERARLSEAYSFVGSDKTLVAERVNVVGATTGLGITADGDKTGHYGGVVVNSGTGVITYTFTGSAGATLSGTNIELTPTLNDNGVTWGCTTTVPAAVTDACAEF